ncbi:MAG: serine hydrolase domain-containing protein [Bacteroidota bacterium]
MTKKLFLSLLSIILGYISFGQHPEEMVLNNNHSLDKKIDSIFKSFNQQTPGVAISIIQNGKLISKKTYGMANIEHKIPFSHQSPVRLGYSGSREFMCAGLALMEANGMLRFDDKVQKYFPALPPWSAGITIQDLLNHSSGFDDEWATLLLMHADMNNRVDKEQLLRLLYRQPKPQVEPGKGYMYCNSDFALLRFIMEIASKQSLPDYLKKNLFAPLNMSSTFMNDNLEQLIPGLAESYYGNGSFFKNGSPKTSPGGNYRIVTNADDLEKWAIAIADSNTIVAKAFSRLYKQARVIPVLSPEKHYVFGHEWHTVNNVDLVKHGGVNLDFYMFRIPSKNISVIGLGNSWNSMSMAMQLADSLLPGKVIAKSIAPKFPAVPESIDKNKLASYTGRYFEQRGNSHSSHLPIIQYYDIKEEAGQLNFYYTPTASFPMISFGKDLFKDTLFNTAMQFSQAHPDSSKKLTAWTPGGKSLVFYKEKSKTKVSSVYLQQYIGQFYSQHLDYYCRVTLNGNGQLVLTRPTVPDVLLEPYGNNRFLFDMDAGGDSWKVIAIFTKNDKGEINGIDMQHIRMMHHRFDKK